MYFNVSQQLKEGVGSTRTYTINETIGSEDEERPVDGVLEFLCTSRSILVTGELETRVIEVCSRCLEKFSQRLELDIEEEYFPVRDINSGTRLEMPEEVEEGFTINEIFTLDLNEVVRQATILAAPMNPVCKPECRGLCPECGHNLNLGDCDCPASPADLRWQSLTSLLRQAGEGH